MNKKQSLNFLKTSIALQICDGHTTLSGKSSFLDFKVPINAV